MQIVTLQDLEKLAKPSLQEKDYVLASSLSFKDVCIEYNKKKKELQDDKINKNTLQFMVYNYMNANYLSKKCPPIVLIGKGSSRTAYACIGGTCLKIAQRDAGIAQNKQEAKHTMKHWWRKEYSCFVQTYDVNDDYALLLSECCALVNRPSQLSDAFGMQDFDVLRAVVKAICDDKKHNISSASSSLKTMATDFKRKGKDFSTMLGYASVAESAAKWLDDLVHTASSKMTPGQKSFSSLVSFWKAHGVSELLPGDVVDDANWGFAIRDGKISPVMIDVGFSKSVANKFYHS